MMNLHFNETADWIADQHGVGGAESDASGKINKDETAFGFDGTGDRPVYVKAEDIQRQGGTSLLNTIAGRGLSGGSTDGHDMLMGMDR